MDVRVASGCLFHLTQHGCALRVISRAAAGQYELETPQQLFKLLATMARNKVLNHVRSQQAERRDHRRNGAAAGLQQVADTAAGPNTVVAGRDLLQKVFDLLSPEERDLARRRAAGGEWAEIAAAVGGTADALRKRCSRALDRVARQLGLEELQHA